VSRCPSPNTDGDRHRQKNPKSGALAAHAYDALGFVKYCDTNRAANKPTAIASAVKPIVFQFMPFAPPLWPASNLLLAE
jgi:hypothetical protein